MSYITTHVLDATAGRPAAGVAVTLATAAGVNRCGLDCRTTRFCRPDGSGSARRATGPKRGQMA